MPMKPKEAVSLPRLPEAGWMVCTVKNMQRLCSSTLHEKFTRGYSSGKRYGGA